MCFTDLNQNTLTVPWREKKNSGDVNSVRCSTDFWAIEALYKSHLICFPYNGLTVQCVLLIGAKIPKF